MCASGWVGGVTSKMVCLVRDNLRVRLVEPRHLLRQILHRLLSDANDSARLLDGIRPVKRLLHPAHRTARRVRGVSKADTDGAVTAHGAEQLPEAYSHKRPSRLPAPLEKGDE